MVLQSAPCHKDNIHPLGSKIGAWKGGQKIEQTDKPYYIIDMNDPKGRSILNRIQV